MRFAILKKWCQVIRSAAPVTQNHLSKPTDLMLQNATPLRKSAPWPPNISHEHVFCTAPATENASLQILFKCPTPAMVFGNATKPSHFAYFWEGAQSLAPATRNELWTSKSGPYVVYFVHFDFEIATSKSAPKLRCFVHFDFEMCFAPQRRALFRHLNFQKWSDPGVFCTFWLGNALRATTACTFSSPDGSAPAALASLLFDPPEPQIIGKTQCFATFLPFRASASSFFWLFLFSDLLWLSSTLLSDPFHLCFSSVHIVGSLTSKLPSIACFYLGYFPRIKTKSWYLVNLITTNVTNIFKHPQVWEMAPLCSPMFHLSLKISGGWNSPPDAAIHEARAQRPSPNRPPARPQPSAVQVGEISKTEFG